MEVLTEVQVQKPQWNTGIKSSYKQTKGINLKGMTRQLPTDNSQPGQFPPTTPLNEFPWVDGYR